MRQPIATALSGVLVLVTGVAEPAAATRPAGTAPSHRPAPVLPAPILRDGTPERAGLLAHHVERAVAAAAAGMSPQPDTGRPHYPGAVVLTARRAIVARTAALGWALRYADSTGAQLPPDRWLPMRTDTIFDVASISKLFTSIAVVQQVERGRLDLDAPVARYIPPFAANGKDTVSVRQLLTHTSGLPAGLPLFNLPDNDARLAAVYAVAPRSAPGAAYLYSDLNMIVLGRLVELASGLSLDAAVRRDITGPLGLSDTGYNPPEPVRPRVAPTEFKGGRGLVWGTVHDENAYSFGGVAGHAGIFSTARDLAVLCQTMLNGGAYGRVRILSAASTALLLANTGAPGHDHGLGFDLYQYPYMGAMATPSSGGHTGFTGTVLVIDPTTDSFLVMLTNKVHPRRDWGSVNPERRAVATELARAVPVRPAQGRAAWFSGIGDGRTATLTLPLPSSHRAAGASLRFALWYDTEPGADAAALESSVDGGDTWTPLPFALGSTGSTVDTPSGTVSGYGGRRWLDASATVPPGAVLVRWRYGSDAVHQGRGVYVDRIRVRSGSTVVFDERRPADAALLRPDGFTPSPD